MSEIEIVSGITRAALAALLERHNLGALDEVEVLRGGTVNPTLRINRDLILRLNQRDPELPKLRWEALIYERLRRETDVPCPDVVALDSARDLVPCDALVLRYVEGVSGDAVWSELDTVAQEHVSEELGRLCASAHTLQWSTYGEFPVADTSFTRSARWTDILNAKLIRAYEHAVRLDLLPPRTLDAVITTFNDGDAIYDEASPPTLTHTDLWLGNVILREHRSRWEVAAIIDWEWSLVADAAWEWASLWRDQDAWPRPDAFIYGYRERRTPPADLRIRVHLYRLLDAFVRAASCAGRYGVTDQITQFHVDQITKLLHKRSA